MRTPSNLEAIVCSLAVARAVATSFTCRGGRWQGRDRRTRSDSSGAILQGASVQLQREGHGCAVRFARRIRIDRSTPGKLQNHGLLRRISALRDRHHRRGRREIQRLDVPMACPRRMKQVLVTADRPRGEAEAINRTRMADNILQVLPAEVITSLPNANVADALGRLPSVTLERIEGEGVYVQVRGTEPRLTNVTINGITRSFARADCAPGATGRDSRRSGRVGRNQQDAGAQSRWRRHRRIGQHENQDRRRVSHAEPLRDRRLQSDSWRPLQRSVRRRPSAIASARREKLGILFGGTYDYNGRGIDNLQPAIDPRVHVRQAALRQQHHSRVSLLPQSLGLCGHRRL